jgi:hypothetical protein
MTLCLSAMRLHLQQSQSLKVQCLLCPFSQEMSPWFLQRAHFGLRAPFSRSGEWRDKPRLGSGDTAEVVLSSISVPTASLRFMAGTD